MELSAARDAKRMVLRGLLEPIRGAASALRAGPAPLEVAVGLAPTDQDAYRLAVRVQSEEALAHPAVQRALAQVEDVDVRVTGQVYAVRPSATTPTSLSGAGSRAGLAPGDSLAHPSVTAGTLGCLVVDEADRLCVLSNNHVLADTDRAALGDLALSPSPIDGGQLSDRIGTLTALVPLSRTVNELDAAIAVLDSRIDVTGNQVDGITLSTALNDDEIAALVGKAGQVKKCGRTTGITYGTVTAVEVDGVNVGYDTGRLLFNRTIEIAGLDSAPFSYGGDSGSVIHTVTGEAVGLLFAGSEQEETPGGVTYANPLHLALAALTLRLPS